MTTMKRYEPTTVNYPARWAMLWGVAAIIAGSAGCTAPDPINAWKKSLATYIVHEGDSDPNILRESGDLRSRRALRPARVVFGKTKIPGPGSPCSGASRDVNGVLAGLAKVGDYRWFVFVVGVQGRRPGRTADLEDVRLVGFTIDGPYFIWRVSPPNPDNLADYRALATVSATDERAGPTSRGIFPGQPMCSIWPFPTASPRSRNRIPK